MKKLYLLLVAFTAISANQLFAQSASITSPNSAASINTGNSLNITGKGSGFGGNSNYTFNWSSVASSGVSFNQATKTQSNSSYTTSATFANAGTYQVSVSISRGSSSAVTSSALTVYVNPASTVSASATSTSLTLPTTASTTLNSSFTSNGNTIGSYVWTQSSSDAIAANFGTPNAASTSVSFMAAGTYHFTVTANYNYQYGSANDQATDNVTITVSPGSTSTYINNLFALSSSGNAFSGFAIGSDSVHSGMVINGMNSLATITATSSSSAALGEDVNGYFYFMPNANNNGNVTVYAMKHDGSQQTSVASIDMNGSSDNSNLGFVRLGVDANGYGWILASNGSNALYLAKFLANGLASTTITLVNSNVSISGGGSASTFGSGDLAFDKYGEMYALANDNNNNTYIYVMNTNLNTTSIARKWTLVDPNGNNFTGTVNGTAFDSAGSMYISTSNGLYFIDATTINTAGVGTVKTRLAYSGSGFTDLATNIFPPKTTLPISLLSFTATKNGSNALIQWSTQTEINSNYVDVERSSNATDFEKVGTVAASGNTSTVQNYQFSDPLAGLSGIVYYRLKEVDIDGQANYSKVIALRLDGSAITSNFSVYPNPFVSALKIITTSDNAQEAALHVFNISGQKVISQSVSLQQGQNVLTLDNLSSLQAGVYVVQLATSNGTISQKIIKH